MQLTGDWGRAAKIASGLQGRFQRAVAQAIAQEAHQIRGDIVKGIRSGSGFAPLSPMTLAVRKFKGLGGSKPLIVTGALVGGITATKVGDGWFVGILRQARSKAGKPLANIGAIHEFGASWSQPLSPKARRFLFAVLKKAGLLHGSGDHVTLKSGARAIRKGGRWRDQKGRFLSGVQLAEAKAASAAAGAAAKAMPKKPGSSTINITIPARPFIGPVVEKAQEGLAKRFWERVAKGMGHDLGSP